MLQPNSKLLKNFAISQYPHANVLKLGHTKIPIFQTDTFIELLNFNAQFLGSCAGMKLFFYHLRDWALIAAALVNPMIIITHKCVLSVLLRQYQQKLPCSLHSCRDEFHLLTPFAHLTLGSLLTSSCVTLSVTLQKHSL